VSPNDFTHDADIPRPVVASTFKLLASLHRLGSARVSELQRDSRIPRTTVTRLLKQLGDVDAVERSAGRWRLGPTLVKLGARVPAEPRLRSVARRPLMELAKATGAFVVLSVEMAGQVLVVEVVPGLHRLAREPSPGMALEKRKLAEIGVEMTDLAAVRAHEQARHGDLRPVIDAGTADPRLSCIAAPLRLSPRDVAAVWSMVPGGAGIPELAVAATRRTAGRIATHLSTPGIVG
jgi:DNA-binding IclR family transcriptional regulator